MFYNGAKGGVDAYDRMCVETSTSRKTNRWPVCIFYGLLNMTSNNAWIIHRYRPGNQRTEKHTFLHTLAMSLSKPLAQQRLDLWGHHYSARLKDNIEQVFKIRMANAQPQVNPYAHQQGAKRRCAVCTRSRDIKVRSQCELETCLKAVCTTHSIRVCFECFARQRR